MLNSQISSPASSASWSPASVPAGSAAVSPHPLQPSSASLCVRLEARSGRLERHAPGPACPAVPHNTLTRDNPQCGLYAVRYRCKYTQMQSSHSRRFSSNWLRMSSSCGCMLLMDWKSESTALSLVMLRPRMWLLFMRLRKVVTAYCRSFRNCSWFSSDSPFWYGCWRTSCNNANDKPITTKEGNLLLRSFSAPLRCWQAEQGHDSPQAGWLQAEVQLKTRGQGLKGWGSFEPLPVSSPNKFCSGNEPAAKMKHGSTKYIGQ